jgi:Diacylglycerol kinase catalytic domain
MRSQRLLAAAALVLTVVGTVLLVVVGIGRLPRGLATVAMVGVAAGIARDGIVRRGASRTIRLVLALVLLVAVVVLTLTGEALVAGLVAVALIVMGLAAARSALRVHARWPAATRPSHPVVVWNAKSGGGKAVAHNLEAEARRRGIHPIELRPGDDLAQLVRDAVAAGADALAAAGGDGTQALVAGIAAEHDLPFACIPAGTRNHFALDLGVDRDDVIGALDALVDGTERRVDLAEVNGRVFVNNVSLGLYAQAVQREGYRDAKLRTILDTAPDVLGAAGDRSGDLVWADDAGQSHQGAAVILVSNDVYRLGLAIGTGTRPRIDAGVLGVAVLAGIERGRGWRQWATTGFRVDSEAAVAAGVDGEALMLDPPLRFTSRPLALRVRIALHHPGTSPSSIHPDSVSGTIRLLWRIVAGYTPRVGAADE